MAKEVNIYLFRHGQTYYNRDKIFTGWKDSKLTPLGIKQAKALGVQLKNKKIDVCFHTILSRSKDTLKEVLKFHPECEELIEANDMIERSYGNLSGFSHKKIVEKYGEKKFGEWHRGWDTRPPKGESFKDVEIRVRRFISDLKKFMKKEKVNVAISAHGNSIRLFRKVMEGLTIEKTKEIKIPYDKIFTYKVKV